MSRLSYSSVTTRDILHRIVSLRITYHYEVVIGICDTYTYIYVSLAL